MIRCRIPAIKCHREVCLNRSLDDTVDDYASTCKRLAVNVIVNIPDVDWYQLVPLKVKLTDGRGEVVASDDALCHVVPHTFEMSRPPKFESVLPRIQELLEGR